MRKAYTCVSPEAGASLGPGKGENYSGMIWVEFYYMCCCICMCLSSLSKFTPHNSLKTGGYIVGQSYAHALFCEHEVNAIMHSTAIPRGWRESCQRF